MEVFQLSNAIIEDMEKGSEQQVFLELSIYNRYVDKSKAINHTKAHKVNVGYGELTITEKWERSKVSSVQYDCFNWSIFFSI